MRYPQLLIYENNGRIAELLRLLANEQRWSLREPRLPSSCLRLLSRGGPTLLILKLGRDLEQELTLLDRVRWLYPETGTVAIYDVDDPVVTGLAWDLGAHHVVFPPQPIEILLDLAAGFMKSPDEPKPHPQDIAADSPDPEA